VGFLISCGGNPYGENLGLGVHGTIRMHKRLKAPFPAFGGKSRVAALVWDRIGDVDNAIEPFANSAAWLLARPHAPRVETVNDLDCYISNWWRAVQHDPEQVAYYADGPVNEADLHARHRWLVLSAHAGRFRQRMRTDPEAYDCRVAGWWVWGACCWIGGGWCQTPESADWDQRPNINKAVGLGVQADSDGGPLGHGATSRVSDFAEGVHNDTHLKRSVAHDGPHPGSAGDVASASGSSPPPLGGSAGGGTGGGGCGHTPPGAEPHSHSTARGQESDATGVHARGTVCHENRRPVIANDDGRGRGVHGEPPKELSQQLPHLGGNHDHGRGVHAGAGGRPQLADARSRGRGVHDDNHLSPGRKPKIDCGSNSYGHGINVKGPGPEGTCAQRRAWLVAWFSRLRDRLRTVRVCCGNWLRVCDSESVTTRLGVTGIMFDPPYSAEAGRDMGLYAQDSGTVAHEVRAYCLERGDNPLLRLALCGYRGEGHEELEKHGWERVDWASQGGYGNRSAKGRANKKKEAIWFSPHCRRETSLYDGLEG
jgi:hypothetical protein